jgi:hypothetical protein
MAGRGVDSAESCNNYNHVMHERIASVVGASTSIATLVC